MITIQDKDISTNNCKKYILKDPNITNDTCGKCQGKSETIQHITGACCALTEGDYTHRHSPVANIVPQELATSCGLSQ
jgi:hypothetical protein